MKNLPLLLIAFMSFLSLPLLASCDELEEQTEERINAFIHAFQNPTKIVMLHYVDHYVDKSWLEMVTHEQLANDFIEEAGQIGDFTVIDVNTNDPLDIILDIKVKNNSKPQRYIVSFGEDAPHGLVGFRTQPYINYENIDIDDLHRLDKAIQTLADEEGFSASIWFAKNDKTLFNQSYGYADKRYQVKINENTRFNLASITKDFTAIAILQLAQQGRLKLDEPIGQLIPELSADKGKKMTIRHLLQHRSGLGEYFSNIAYEASKHTFTSIEDYLDVIVTLPLSFAPGTDEDYSNSGYELLGVIIQRVSGMDYYQYVKKHVFEKAHMVNSGYWQSSLALPNLARHYTNESELGPDQGYVRETTYIWPSIGSASGGAMGTMNDLQQYLIALEKGELLNDDYSWMFFNNFKPVSERPPGSPFLPAGLISGAGGAPGVNTLYMYHIEKGIKLIILSNVDERIAENIGVHIYQQLEKD